MKSLFTILLILTLASCSNKETKTDVISEIAEKCKGIGIVVGECVNENGTFYTVKDEENNYFTYLDDNFGYKLNDTIK
jgi:hypothetical protein